MPLPPKQRERITRSHRAMKPDAMEKFVQKALLAQEHLWLAVAAFQLPDSALQDLDNPSPADLDSENLLSINVGCYVCETPLRKGLVGTICPGMR